MSATAACGDPRPWEGGTCQVTVTVADDWSRSQFPTCGGTTITAATEITIGLCSLCGGEVKASALWMGGKPAARCTRCHAVEAPPKLPVIEMVAPYVAPEVMVSGLPLSQSVDTLLGDSAL